MRFKFSLKNITIVLGFVWFHYSACSTGVTLVFRVVFSCSTTVPGCSAVLPVFHVPLFRVPAFLVLWYAVFIPRKLQNARYVSSIPVLSLLLKIPFLEC